MSVTRSALLCAGVGLAALLSAGTAQAVPTAVGTVYEVSSALATNATTASVAAAIVAGDPHASFSAPSNPLNFASGALYTIGEFIASGGGSPLRKNSSS